MSVRLRSFAKINLGLHIGPLRADGFHALTTVYQTIGLHDVITVSVERGSGRGSGIDIRCDDSRVPRDESNTCWRIAEKTMRALKARGRVVIEIEKQLPVQGGLGGASSNAVATLLGLERALKKSLPMQDRLQIAAEVGSDLPLFLLGGTILGVGRGEKVFPLPELPSTACVVVTPDVGVSTPKAFADWDRRAAKLTAGAASDKINELGSELSSWLSELASTSAPLPRTGKGGQAVNPLHGLVRAGIANDFEEVVFPEYPELREGKRALERAGAQYASLSGSGSTLYGLFGSGAAAKRAAERLRRQGWKALATTTLTRRAYWKRLLV